MKWNEIKKNEIKLNEEKWKSLTYILRRWNFDNNRKTGNDLEKKNYFQRLHQVTEIGDSRYMRAVSENTEIERILRA